MKRVLCVCGLLLLPAAAFAQAPPAPDSWTLRVYAVGAAAPQATRTFPLAEVTCGQTTIVAVTPIVNPNTVEIGDPSNSGKSCLWTDPGTGPLFSVPIGSSYEATLAAVANGVPSAETARVPFSRQAIVPPSVPSGFTLLKR